MIKNKKGKKDITPTYKIILIGEAGVGKTCIIQRYIEETFNKEVKTTVGVSFLSKTIEIDDQVISLEIWDTVGGEQYKSMSNMFSMVHQQSYLFMILLNHILIKN